MKIVLGWCLRHPVILVVCLFFFIAIVYRQAIFKLDDGQPIVGDKAASSGLVVVGNDQGVPTSGGGAASTTASARSDDQLPTLRSATESPAVNTEEVDPTVEWRFRPNQKQPELPTPALDALLQQARRAYWSGDEVRAISLYQAVIEQYPANPQPHGELANIYFKQGVLDLAVAHYQQALDLLQHAGDSGQAQALYRAIERELPGKLRRPSM